MEGEVLVGGSVGRLGGSDGEELLGSALASWWVALAESVGRVGRFMCPVLQPNPLLWCIVNSGMLVRT